MHNSGLNIIKDFQLAPLSIQEKSSKEYGLAIAKYINNTVGNGYSGYYFDRNNQFLSNRLAANGRIPMQQFMDMLGFNGKFNYANLNWESLKIVNRIISGWVGKGMGRREKIVVQATDTLSEKQKQEQYEELEFFVYNRKMLEEVGAEAGVQMLPQGQELPEDQNELELWRSELIRLPEEILYETGCNNVLQANGFFDVLKQKLLHDSAEVGLVGTYTWMDDQGVIHVDYVHPENMIYSWTIYPDFRDTTWRGQKKSLKISEIRRRYGKEFGGDLSEEDLFKIAATCKDYQRNDKLVWNAEWTMAFLRPYDEWNADVIDFEFRSVDKESYTVTQTKQNKNTILEKKKPKKLKENQQYIEDTHWNIYRGVYMCGVDMMLEWGLKKNMIRPQDPKEIGNAEFSYSFYMYQNYQMRNIAIPQKIMVQVRQMILIEMKMQQLVAKMRPVGAAINWDALQNIDYGLGDANKDIDIKKLYDQSGDIYYRGRDAEGNAIPIPINELKNSGFIEQMQGLIQLYQFQYQQLKDELGENPELMTQALQPRVTAGNVMAAQEASGNATNYMYDAYLRVMEETAKKISCLMQDSVLFGAKVYRSLLREEDVANRIFSTKSEMLPTDQDIALLNEKLNQAIASNPDLVMYLDTYKVLRIARENVKLADLYYNNAMKKMLASKMQQAQQNAQMNAEAQQQSVMAKGQMDMELKKMEAETKEAEIRLQGETQIKAAVINMVASLVGKGAPIPENFKPLVNAVINNTMLPLVAETHQQQMAIQQGMQMAAQQQEQEMQEQGGMEQNMSPENLQQHEAAETPEMESAEEENIIQEPM